MSLETWSGSKSAQEKAQRSVPRVGRRIAISFYAGLVVYCAVSLFFGPAGFASYRRLEARRLAMQSNLADLEEIRAGLSSDLESLKSNPDRLAREARRLGYLRDGETALILGESPERSYPIETGRVLPYAEPPSICDAAIKQIALGACLAMMAILFSRGRTNGRQGADRRYRGEKPGLRTER